MLRPYPYQSWSKAAPGELGAAPQPGRAFTPDRWVAAGATATRLLRARPCLSTAGPQAHRTGPAGPQVGIQLRRGVETHPWLLSLPAPLAAQLADRTLGGDGLGPHAAALLASAPPLDELASGALAYALSRMLASLASGDPAGGLSFDGFVEIDRLHASVAEAGFLGFAVSVELDGHVSQCWLWCHASTARTRARPVLHRPLAAVPLVLQAIVGRTVVGASQLRRLSPGDVITLEQWSLPADEVAAGHETELWALGAKRPLIRAEITPGGIRILAMHLREEHTMGEDISGEAQAGKLLSELTGDAPIALQVEMARFSVPLQQLLELQPGELLSTGTRVGTDVALVAAGHVVATGELVDIEGVVGVRVRTVAGAKTGRDGPQTA